MNGQSKSSSTGQINDVGLSQYPNHNSEIKLKAKTNMSQSLEDLTESFGDKSRLEIALPRNRKINDDTDGICAVQENSKWSASVNQNLHQNTVVTLETANNNRSERSFLIDSKYYYKHGFPSELYFNDAGRVQRQPHMSETGHYESSDLSLYPTKQYSKQSSSDWWPISRKKALTVEEICKRANDFIYDFDEMENIPDSHFSKTHKLSNISGNKSENDKHLPHTPVISDKSLAQSSSNDGIIINNANTKRHQRNKSMISTNWKEMKSSSNELKLGSSVITVEKDPNNNIPKASTVGQISYLDELTTKTSLVVGQHVGYNSESTRIIPKQETLVPHKTASLAQQRNISRTLAARKTSNFLAAYGKIMEEIDTDNKNIAENSFGDNAETNADLKNKNTNNCNRHTRCIGIAKCKYTRNVSKFQNTLPSKTNFSGEDQKTKSSSTCSTSKSGRKKLKNMSVSGIQLREKQYGPSLVIPHGTKCKKANEPNPGKKYNKTPTTKSLMRTKDRNAFSNLKESNSHQQKSRIPKYVHFTDNM